MLNKLFISKVRVEILKTMLLHPDKDMHVRAIVRAVGAEINAVRRELDNLVNIGILKRRQSSNKIVYAVVTDHIFYTDLVSLISKESRISQKIFKALKSLGELEYIMLSKAYIRGRKSTVLDVDLFFVGNVDETTLEKLIKEEEDDEGREINYSVMKPEEFMSRKRTGDQFIIRLMSQGRVMLLGDEEKFFSVV